MSLPVQPQPTPASPAPATPAEPQLTPDQQFEILQNAVLERQGISGETDGQDEMTEIKRQLVKQEFRRQFADSRDGVKELLPNMSNEQFAEFMRAATVDSNFVDAAKILIEATRKNDEVQSSKDDADDKGLSVEGNPTSTGKDNNPPADMFEATDRIKARFR